MKKPFFILFLALCAQVVWAANVTAPSQIPAYWASVDGKSGGDLWKAVSSATNVGYSSIGYKGLYKAYLKTDVYPKDSVGKAGKIWDMYGECEFSPGNTCGSYKGVCDCYNREHSIPQSWWGGGTSGIGNDIFHVLPTDGKVNGVRSNFEYGEVNGGTNWVGNKFGSAASWSTDKKTIASAAGETVKGSGNVFEPKPQYKGDIARGLLGTIVKWQQSNITTGNNFFNGTYTVSGNFGLTKKAVVLLMKWHREDPVSQKEIDRNNGIQETQGNRNPFIDYPYLAEYIWGEHAGETVDLSQLIPSTDPSFVPGVSDGSAGGSVDPGTQYTVTWMADGSEHAQNMAYANAKAIIPADPAACETVTRVFRGWTAQSTVEEEPADLFVSVSPTITEDVTFYAVYANEQIISGAGSTGTAAFTPADFDGQGTSGGGSPVLATVDGVSFSCNKGYGTSASLRCYNGGKIIITSTNSIEAVAFTFDGNYTGDLESTYTGLKTTEWEKTLGSQARFKAIQVSFAGGSTTMYSHYGLYCVDEDLTPVEEVQVNVSALKVLMNGRLYILREGKMYNLQGMEVR